MTKREFDAATQENWGSRCMASDERMRYRDRRGHRPAREDFLARRMVERLPHLPTLALGQKWRSVAAYRAGRLPMLVDGRALPSYC